MAEVEPIVLRLLRERVRPNATIVGRAWREGPSKRCRPTKRGRPQWPGVYHPNDEWTIEKEFARGHVVKAPAQHERGKAYVFFVESDPVGKHWSTRGPSCHDDGRGGHYTKVVVEYSPTQAHDRLPPHNRKHLRRLRRVSAQILDAHRPVRIDKRKHEDLTGIMVGAGYHLYNGLVTPYVPTVDKFIVPKRRKCSEMWGVGEGNAVSATGEEAHHKDKGDEEEELAPVPNFRFLSALERLEAIFEAIFAGGVFKEHEAGYAELRARVKAFSHLAFALSKNLNNSAHLDVGDGSRCFAIWMRTCMSADAPRSWWLLFPSVGLAIQLAPGVRVSWDGRHCSHCSVSHPREGDSLISIFVAGKEAVFDAWRRKARFDALQTGGELRVGSHVVVRLGAPGTTLSSSHAARIAEGVIQSIGADSMVQVALREGGILASHYDDVRLCE